MHPSPITLTGLQAATMQPGADPYGLIQDAALVLKDGKIAWIGPRADLPAEHAALPQKDMGGRLITPALIDCHTHVVHGGNRAVEFEMRLQGASYEEVARAGGGIISTVKATRTASQADLVTAALPFVDAMIAEGVAVIEIKSGYGLNQDTELRMLRAAREIASCEQSPSKPASSPPMPSRLNTKTAPTPISTKSPSPPCTPPMPRVSSMPWMASAKASPFPRRKLNACSTVAAQLSMPGKTPRRTTLQPRRRSACRSLSTRSPPIIWNISTKQG